MEALLNYPQETKKKELCTNVIKLTLNSKLNIEEAIVATNFQNWKKF